MKKFNIKTTGILICAVYSSVIFLRGIFIDVFTKPDVFIKTIFEYRVLTGRLYEISFCVFLFLLYFYNKDKIKLSMLKINAVAAGILLVLMVAPYFVGAINGIMMQARGFSLARVNFSLLNTLYILGLSGAGLAFMLLVLLQYKKTLTAIFILLNAVYLQFLIDMMFHITGGLLNLITFLIFMLFFILNTILLLLYAIKVEFKRSQTQENLRSEKSITSVE